MMKRLCDYEVHTVRYTATQTIIHRDDWTHHVRAEIKPDQSFAWQVLGPKGVHGAALAKEWVLAHAPYRGQTCIEFVAVDSAPAPETFIDVTP